MEAPRYILEPEASLRATLDGFLGRLAADLAAQPEQAGVAALVLGGGYGRGEGGVYRASEESAAALYNDLEFFLFVRDPAARPALSAWCHRWERDGSQELGIDVEFKVSPATALTGAEPTMFYFDLLQGHRLVFGSAEFLATAPAVLRDAARLPLSEPARLLFNRGSGLLFARWRLEADPLDSDGFAERNHAKARLALADAVLAAAGRHDGSCRERARRLAQADFPTPPNFERLLKWHAEGVEFKLRPRHRRPGAAALAADNRLLAAAWLETFLWLETRRLGSAFKAGRDYVTHPGRLFPASGRTANLLRMIRDRVRRGSALPSWFDYPRASLQRALVAALTPELGESAAAGNLRVSVDSWRATYQQWWGRYN